MPNKTRTAIFAHFDKDNVIDDYVIYYLNALKKVAQKIIFVSDCNLSPAETDKLKNITDEIIANPHGEYDFGSYKRGFLFAQENNLLDETDELIFANDSCYGPFCSLEKVFEKMDSKTCDFWGITQSRFGYRKKGFNPTRKRQLHLQSYFFVLKKKVFLSETFKNFINSIKKQNDKSNVITCYELGLSKTLMDEGFIAESFIEDFDNSFNASICFWDKLISEKNMPFLKCSIPRLGNLRYVICDNYEKIVANVSDYPLELIRKNVKRTSENKDYLSFLPANLRVFTYRLIHFLKNLAKKNATKE